MSQIDTYCVYGISIASDYPFQYPLIRTNKPADVVFSCTTKPPAKVPKSVLSQDNILTVKTPHCQRTVFVSELADDSYVLQFRDYLVFWVRPDSITAYIQNLPDPSILDMLLFGPALALWRFLKCLKDKNAYSSVKRIYHKSPRERHTCSKDLQKYKALHFP